MGRALDGPKPRSAPRFLSPSLTVSVAPGEGLDGTRTARSPPLFPKGVPALSPQSHTALGRRKAATLAPLLRVPDRFSLYLSGRAGSPGRRGCRRTDSWGGFPAVTAPLQPRSSLPLRVAPAFCFTRGTTNAAAAMLTTEPGGGAGVGAPSAAARVPPTAPPAGPNPAYPSSYRLPPGSFKGTQVAHRASGAWRPSAPSPLLGRPSPFGAAGSLLRPGCAWFLVAYAAARMQAAVGKCGVN